MTEIDGRDLLAEVAAQRNRAMDEAANYAAQVATLRRRVAELEKQLGSRPSDEPN